MSVALNTETYTLSYNSSLNTSYRIKQIDFGDGYTQSALDGINYQKEIWSLEFNVLEIASILILEALLLESVNGSTNILSWTPPSESTTKYWIASAVSRTPVGGKFKLSCTLTRSFLII